MKVRQHVLSQAAVCFTAQAGNYDHMALQGEPCACWRLLRRVMWLTLSKSDPQTEGLSQALSCIRV